MSEIRPNTHLSDTAPGKKIIGRPFQKGLSGNPGGRPRIEPRIRRYGRRFDRRVVAELWKIGSDPQVEPDVRRRCLMDLQSIGNGRPVTSQEVVGKGAPLVNLNFATLGAPITSPQEAALVYAEVCRGTIDATSVEFAPSEVSP